jgi:hypothetical protein
MSGSRQQKSFSRHRLTRAGVETWDSNSANLTDDAPRQRFSSRVPFGTALSGSVEKGISYSSAVPLKWALAQDRSKSKEPRACRFSY